MLTLDYTNVIIYIDNIIYYMLHVDYKNTCMVTFDNVNLTWC